MNRTDEQLHQVIGLVEELITWAEADAEQSEESDAPDQAKDDRRRATILRKAREQLLECKR